jgi:hypothetical protein
MQYMMLYQPGKETDVPPSLREMADMGQLIDEMTKAGVLIATGGLQPSSKGVRVAKSGDKITVTDGPFAETKELIAGFAIVEVKSKDEAIGLAQRFLEVVGGGVSEVRPMHGAPILATV